MSNFKIQEGQGHAVPPLPTRFVVTAVTGRPNNFAESATNLCARIMPHFCVYALTAIPQVRRVASFYSQHGICVILFMWLANNRVWSHEKKTCKLSCDFFTVSEHLLRFICFFVPNVASELTAHQTLLQNDMWNFVVIFFCCGID